MQLKGARKKQTQHKPSIEKDSLSSLSIFKGLYGLCEGEILGLADGSKSIRLDDTPIINANGQPNFEGVSFDFRLGTLEQTRISGFPSVENEQNIGVELRHDRPFVRQISNSQLSALRIRLNFNALREQKDNGDITGYAIEYAIDVQTDGGVFNEVFRHTVSGKASQGFKKSHRIDLPKANRWTVRVRRITPNRDSDLIADVMTVDAITEIIDAKLAYPCTALLGVQYNAETFGNIAKIAVRLKGKLIQVPTNYNPDTRQYHGLWDGRFKLAYSNNPAWVFYDLCTHHRYGLGERLTGLVDKWSLYTLAQYCDEFVDDGQGGKEPRFTVNVYIQKADDAYQILQNLASVFRAISYYNGNQIIVDADVPKEPVYTFSRANVIDGKFNYTGTRARDRHTAAKVAWDDPNNDFNTDYEWIYDDYAIAKYGMRVLEINAFGCTSRGQAQRAGLWALKSEQLETQQLSFATGLQGFIPQVGQIINIADDVFAGRAISGRIVSISRRRYITLDRTAGKVGDTFSTLSTNGTAISAKIIAVNDTTLTLDKALSVNKGAVWAIISDDLRLMPFRVLSVKQNDNATFEIQALAYNPNKFDAVDKGAIVKPIPTSVLKTATLDAPKQVIISQSQKIHQGQSITTMTISWDKVEGAVAYQASFKKDDGNWISLAKTSGLSVDVDGVYAGQYLAKVVAIDAFGNESLATSSTLTHIQGKIGKPSKLAYLKAQGVLFGISLSWGFGAGSDDTAYTEIQLSPDGQSNITTLAQFAYPTDKHDITGLQGNLTQFYRARIVDKLGNVSDWTDWVSATTDASADKVLELLQGEIDESHLAKTLKEPISKIQGLVEFNDYLYPHLAQFHEKHANAQSAIEDLMADKDAKSAEMVNLKQSVDDNTGQLRELAITTGQISSKYSQLESQNSDTKAKLESLNTAVSNANAAISATQSQLSAGLKVGEEFATLKQETQAQIKTLGDTISAETSKIQTLQTTLNGQTTSLQSIQRSVDGLSAEYAIKLDSGGRIAGFGLAGSGATSFDFAVRADKFYIAPPEGSGNGESPFVVVTKRSGGIIGGTRISQGVYIKDSFIQNASITSAKIADASITNAKIANAEIDTLKIKGNAVVVPRVVYNQGVRMDTLERGLKEWEWEWLSASIDAQGGTVLVSWWADKLFAAPNGMRFSSFATMVENYDFQTYRDNFVLQNNEILVGDVVILIKRNGQQIYRKAFTGNHSYSLNAENSHYLGETKRALLMGSGTHFNYSDQPVIMHNNIGAQGIIDTPPAGIVNYTFHVLLRMSAAFNQFYRDATEVWDSSVHKPQVLMRNYNLSLFVAKR